MTELSGEGSRCVIRRVGLVMEADENGATVAIGGKSLRLAREKVAEGVSPGDAVEWDGKIWRVSKDADTGTSNMRKAQCRPHPLMRRPIRILPKERMMTPMEVLDTKRCLFCDSLVQVKHKGGCDWYMNCLCSPSGTYGLTDDSYEPFRLLSYSDKRNMFPIISAYIREKSDCEEVVIISFDERDAILLSPQIPLTTEEKGLRLLRYLHRHASGPEDPVVINQFSQSFEPDVLLELAGARLHRREAEGRRHDRTDRLDVPPHGQGLAGGGIQRDGQGAQALLRPAA